MRHRTSQPSITRRLSRIGTGLVAITAAGATLAACTTPTSGGGGGGSSSGSGGTPQSGGHMTVALAEAPDALDPTVASTFVGRIVFVNMCEKLYDSNKALNIVPQLATALPKISNGGKTYTIKLRSGVKFNDGTPFNAQAVKTTLEHYKTDPKSARAAELTAIKTIQAVNPTTVKLQLSTPYAPLTSILADRSGMILSPTQLKKLGDNFANHPVCVGPFSFVSRPSSDTIKLKKSSYYYDKSKVKLNSVTFEVVTQPNVRAANLRSGDVNIADRLAPPDVQTLQNNQTVAVRSVTSLGYEGISINVSNSHGAGKQPFTAVSTPLAQHQQLRQAFALSLNRDAINKVVFDGQYKPDCTPISPNSPFYPNVTCPPQNLAKAKQLVAQSGVKTPIPVKLIVQASNDESTKLGEVIQSMAKKAGFAVSVQPTEFTTALNQAANGKFDTFQVGWSGRLDPDQNIAPFWDPASLLNYTGAHYADVDKLMQQARLTTNQARRKQYYQQLCQKFLKYDNIIYLYHDVYALGLGKNVSGVQFYGDGLIRLKTAGFTGS
jgi:peptide/nickel transport system substrate-binding protein